MSRIYNHTAGRILLPVLYHAAYNLTLAASKIPGRQPGHNDDRSEIRGQSIVSPISYS